MKLIWKPNAFQTSLTLSKLWFCLMPAVKYPDLLTHLTARSLPDLSEATSEIHKASNPVKLFLSFENLG